MSYLDVAILPGEENNNRQTAYDDAGQDEYGRAHYPVQGHNTGTVILAGLTALCALQTLEHSRLAILVVHLLQAVLRGKGMHYSLLGGLATSKLNLICMCWRPELPPSQGRSSVFCNMSPCCLEHICFKATCYFHLQGRR